MLYTRIVIAQNKKSDIHMTYYRGKACINVSCSKSNIIFAISKHLISPTDETNKSIIIIMQKKKFYTLQLMIQTIDLKDRRYLYGEKKYKTFLHNPFITSSFIFYGFRY